jgi:hypothetical protein
MVKCLQIVDLLEGVPTELQLIQPARRFVKEGSLGKISKGKLQERHFYLFNGNFVTNKLN